MPSTALALDIGATTVCATVRDRNGRIANVRVDNSDTVPARLVVDRGTPGRHTETTRPQSPNWALSSTDSTSHLQS